MNAFDRFPKFPLIVQHVFTIDYTGVAAPPVPQCEGSSKGSWRTSVLRVLQPQPPIIEDEDGDLAMPREELQESPSSGR